MDDALRQRINQPAQHTPGPWTYRRAKNHFHIEASAAGYGKRVATVHYVANGDTGWTSETNARLIAAATELLGALHLFMRCQASDGTRCAPNVSDFEAGAAAIRKATEEGL